MALPAVTKTWNFGGINQRVTFVSLNDAAAATLFAIKNFLVATLGWTVKYTCDGTTGPTSSSDHTDRWASKANCTTRGASNVVAQSFAVLTNGSGVDLMLAYQGATDDVFRVSFSQGALFLPAGTANQQPTATDEVLIASTLTIVGATASADRILHIFGTTDKKQFRCLVYRSGAVQSYLQLEEVTSAVASSFAWTPPVVGHHASVVSAANAGATVGGSRSAAAATAGNSGTQAARIGSNTLLCGGGGEAYINVAGLNAFTNGNPELQAGAPIVPHVYASNTVNFGGKVGTSIDKWLIHSTGITDGTMLGTNQFVYANSFLHPWDGASAFTTS